MGGILLGAFAIVPLPSTASIADRGDANCDGEIRHDDIAALVAHLYAPPALPAEDECGADVNGDGVVSIADVVALLDPVVQHASTSIAVLVMGDGMGPVHVEAGVIWSSEPLGFLHFPVVVPAVETSSLTTLETGAPTDSAAAATAFATGVRVFNGEISRRAGMDLVTLGELAAGAGKSVGLVTNSYLFDASPAAFVAHAVQRERLNEIADDYLALAPDVLMGATPRPFRNLPTFVEDFIELARARGYTVVRTAAELEGLDLSKVRRLLGLFDVDFDIGLDLLGRTLFPIHGTPPPLRMINSADPTLARAAEIAVQILSRNPYGFFLFVENENIDTMSHAGSYTLQTVLPIGTLVGAEVASLAEAAESVQSALSAAGRADDAVIVVTADHECGGFTFPNGDPALGTFPAAPNHTTVPVPLYATGAGAERFASVADVVEVFHAFRPSVR